MASEKCYFCYGAVNPHDPQTMKQITAWVGGPKSDGASLREDTGKYAHPGCIKKAKAGQAVDQPELFVVK